MWRRFRRRSMAPSRPAVFPEQVGLLMVSLFVIVAALVFLVLIVF